MQAISMPTVYGWLKRWQCDGVEGLANKPKSGRPVKADDAYSQALACVLKQEPKEQGYNFAFWTVDHSRQHLEKGIGIALSELRLRALMKRKGHRYRRSKHDLAHLQDKEAKAQVAEPLESLKKRASDTILSSSLRLMLDPSLRACWMKVGRQKRVPATRPGEKQKRHVLGGYNWAKDIITWSTALIKKKPLPLSCSWKNCRSSNTRLDAL